MAVVGFPNHVGPVAFVPVVLQRSVQQAAAIVKHVVVGERNAGGVERAEAESI